MEKAAGGGGAAALGRPMIPPIAPPAVPPATAASPAALSLAFATSAQTAVWSLPLLTARLRSLWAISSVDAAKVVTASDPRLVQRPCSTQKVATGVRPDFGGRIRSVVKTRVSDGRKRQQIDRKNARSVVREERQQTRLRTRHQQTGGDIRPGQSKRHKVATLRLNGYGLGWWSMANAWCRP